MMARVHTADVYQAMRPKRPLAPMSLRIVTVNAGARIKNEVKLQAWLMKSKFYKHVPDIVCIQELDES